MDYPYLLPAAAAFVVAFLVVPVVLMAAPVLERTGRRLALLAVVLLLAFGGFGGAKTYAAHYRWLCVSHHSDADICRTYGQDPVPPRLGAWMIRHFG